MNSFVVLPHTADIRLKVRADTFQQLFRTALEGMNSIIKRGFQPPQSLMNFRDVINVESSDRSSLLIDFLSAVLTLSHAHKALYHDCKFDELSETRLKAEVIGDAIDGFDEDIKAVTYTEAEIKEIDGEYEVIIVFDV